MPLSKEDAADRHRYAAQLAKLESLPLLEFSQDSDGVFRAIVPREPVVQLRLVRPKTSPHPTYKPFVLKHKRKEVLTLAERLELQLSDYRYSRKEVLMERLTLYRKEEKAKKRKK